MIGAVSLPKAAASTRDAAPILTTSFFRREAEDRVDCVGGVVQSERGRGGGLDLSPGKSIEAPTTGGFHLLHDQIMPGPTPPRRSRFAVWRWPRWVWYVIVPLMVLGYPLSVGPAAVLYDGRLPPSMMTVAEIAYLPLIQVCELFPPLYDALQRYVQWWLDWA